jgi:hypothetical protein
MEQGKELTNLLGHLFQRLANKSAQDMQIEGKLLRGDVEASAVVLITLRYRNPYHRQRMLRLVVKQLMGRPAREAVNYQQLVATHARDLAPRLLGVERTGPEDVLLLIEAVRRTSTWPWRNIDAGRELLARLAEFHMAARDAGALVPEWDYETELRTVAEHTRTALERCRNNPDLSVLARELPPLNRIAHALPRLRRQLLSERPFGSRPIHGDLHPGNVLVCRRDGRDKAILLDWGRARVASPLEDVSSWLQSVSYWEPESRRRYDTLLAAYCRCLAWTGG